MNMGVQKSATGKSSLLCSQPHCSSLLSECPGGPAALQFEMHMDRTTNSKAVNDQQCSRVQPLCKHSTSIAYKANTDAAGLSLP